MLLNVTKKQTKSEIDPTLQARVNKDLYDQFTKLAEQYGYSNAELIRASKLAISPAFSNPDPP